MSGTSDLLYENVDQYINQANVILCLTFSVIVNVIQTCTMNLDLFVFRIIRLTSPVLSYVIVSGAVLMYLSVFIGFLPATHEPLFMAQCIVS